jgi:hypothetical protein
LKIIYFKNLLKMNNTTLKTIGKYALLLSIFYGTTILLQQLIRHYSGGISDVDLKGILMTMPFAIMFLLNVITALVIYKDIKKLKINAKYSILLTIFYRPIGVILFVLYVINKELDEKSGANRVTAPPVKTDGESLSPPP